MRPTTKIRIYSDNDEVYADGYKLRIGTVLSADKLIDGFIEANEKDEEMEDYIRSLSTEEAIDFIADAWGLAIELAESIRPRGRMLREAPDGRDPGYGGTIVSDGTYWFKIATSYSNGRSVSNKYKGDLSVIIARDNDEIYRAEIQPKNGNVHVSGGSVISMYKDEACKNFVCDFRLAARKKVSGESISARRVKTKDKDVVEIYMARV